MHTPLRCTARVHTPGIPSGHTPPRYTPRTPCASRQSNQILDPVHKPLAACRIWRLPYTRQAMHDAHTLDPQCGCHTLRFHYWRWLAGDFAQRRPVRILLQSVCFGKQLKEVCSPCEKCVCVCTSRAKRLIRKSGHTLRLPDTLSPYSLHHSISILSLLQNSFSPASREDKKR